MCTQLLLSPGALNLPISPIMCYLLLILSLFLCKVSAEWNSFNPGGGGSFNSPVITKEGYFVVGSDLGGVYVSKNQGSNWRAIGATRGLTATHVSSIASHPSKRLIIGTEGGIYVSRSDGKKAKLVFRGKYTTAIAVSASQPNIAYAAYHDSYNSVGPSLLKSSNGGLKWSFVRTQGLSKNIRVLAIRIHPTNSNIVWLISGDDRFVDSPNSAYLSTNGGKKFQLRHPKRNSRVVDVAFGKGAPGKWRTYVTTFDSSRGNLFVSENNGGQWRVMDGSSQQGGISGIILTDWKKAGHVRVVDLLWRGSSQTALWKTVNSGRSWSRVVNRVVGGWSDYDEDWGLSGSFNGDLHSIAYRPDSPQVILWVNTQFVYKSVDGGRTWVDCVSVRKGKNRWASRGIDNVVPMVVAPSAADKNLIYAGYMDLGIWRSVDGGESWENLNPGRKWTDLWDGKGGNTLSIAADPDRSNVVWANVGGDIGGMAYILKSTDKGRRWTQVTKGLPTKKRKYIESLEIALDSPKSRRWLYVVVDGDVYLSEDDGLSWKLSLRCTSCAGVRYTEQSGIVAFGSSGIYRSWQGGRRGTWSELTKNLPTTARSRWTKSQHWHDDAWTYVGPVDVASRPTSGELWLAVKGKGLYYSSNYGSTWSKVYGSKHARSVSVDPRTKEVLFGTSSSLYAGGYESDSKGVVVHKNGKTSKGWKSMNSGLVFPFATYIAVSATGERWCISPGQGIMKWV